jgi:hypothetical protein
MPAHPILLDLIILIILGEEYKPQSFSCSLTLYFSLVCNLFSRQPHKVFTLLSRRGATEHSSNRPRFSTHNLLIVFNVSIQIANKLGNLKKNEAPRYAIFSVLPSPQLSSVQISSSAPCSQTPSVYVPLLMSETNFHILS